MDKYDISTLTHVDYWTVLVNVACFYLQQIRQGIVDGSASEPALRQDTGYMHDKNIYMIGCKHPNGHFSSSFIFGLDSLYPVVFGRFPRPKMCHFGIKSGFLPFY